MQTFKEKDNNGDRHTNEGNGIWFYYMNEKQLIQNKLIKCKEELSSFAFSQTKPVQDKFKANKQFAFKVSPAATLRKQYIHCNIHAVFADTHLSHLKGEFFG